MTPSFDSPGSCVDGIAIDSALTLALTRSHRRSVLKAAPRAVAHLHPPRDRPTSLVSRSPAPCSTATTWLSAAAVVSRRVAAARNGLSPEMAGHHSCAEAAKFESVQRRAVRSGSQALVPIVPCMLIAVMCVWFLSAPAVAWVVAGALRPAEVRDGDLTTGQWWGEEDFVISQAA